MKKNICKQSLIEKNNNKFKIVVISFFIDKFILFRLPIEFVDGWYQFHLDRMPLSSDAFQVFESESFAYEQRPIKEKD